MILEQDRQIIINDSFIKGYEYLKLTQKINDHHSFELAIDLEAIEKTGAHTIEKSKDWLGKTIIINTHGKDFTGIVTNIYLNHDNGHHGQIILKGYSSTIILENGEHMQSWLNKDLNKIVKSITNHPKITASIKPKYTSIITYETQYAESNFQFLQRLAKQYHEWLYYDGDTLFFGKPKKKDPVKLIYGQDITEMQIGIQTQARKYLSFSHNSFTNENYNSKSPDTPSGLNELGQLAFNASLTNYQEPTNVYSKMRVGNKADLDTYLEKKQQSESAMSNFITVKSKRRGLTVGDIIDLRSEIVKGKGAFLNERHGEYIIIEIEHHAKVGNYYSNTITALPADIKVLPEPKINFPVAQTQMATVVDNEDPKGKGRVQVKMHWQVGEMRTSWIRVLTPDGGSSDKVSTNRGFVFIPEKGDQVLISFRYTDPNRPFVMGSLFNGTTGTGGDQKNKIKRISTRSGNTIAMNDKNGSVTIADPSGNVVMMKGNGQIVIKAPNSLTFVSKDINILASNSINVLAEPNEGDDNGGDGIININAKKNIDVKAQEETISIKAKTDLELKSLDASTTVYAKTDMKIEGGISTELNSEKTTINGGSQLIISSSDTDIM